MAGLAMPIGAAVLAMLVPGYLLGRFMGISRVWGICAAPALGLAVLALATNVLGVLHVPANAMSVLVVPSVLLFVAAVARMLMSAQARRQWERASRNRATRRKGAPSGQGGSLVQLPRLSLGWPILYVLVGIFVCRFVFLSMLAAPDTLAVSRDLPHHINQVRAFLDSGVWSSINPDLFQTAADVAIDPISPGGSGFYPSLWHAICTLVVQLAHVPVAHAINAVNAVFLGVCLPLSALSFLAFVWHDDWRVLLAGSIACVSFVAFPWQVLSYGPIYPNLCGFCVTLGCIWPLMRFADDGVRRSERMVLAAVFALACLGVAFLHPNSVIAACLIAVPYLGMRVLRARRGWHVAGRSIDARIVLVACLVLGAGLWYGMYRAPFMRSTVSMVWDFNLSEAQGFVNWLMLAYLNVLPFGRNYGQPVLAALLVAGMVWTLRNRRWTWVTLTYVLGSVPLLVSLTMGRYRHIFAGFWYTDPPRLGAVAVLAGIPLAALALAQVMRLVAGLLQLEGAGAASDSDDVAMATAVDTGSDEPASAASATKRVAVTNRGDITVTAAAKDRGAATAGTKRGSAAQGRLANGRSQQQGDNAQEATRRVSGSWQPVVAAVLAMGVFAVAVFFPSFYAPGISAAEVAEDVKGELQVHTAFEYQRAYYRKSAFVENGEYSRLERRFMEQVHDLVGSDAVVANNPFDGSVLAYGDCGVRTYYRSLLGFEDGAETEASRIIRSSLVNVAQSELVADTVHKLGIQYVVKLSPVTYDGSSFRWNYASAQWVGIDWIGPDTPGFELVMEQDGYQLYRIVV